MERMNKILILKTLSGLWEGGGGFKYPELGETKQN
jgi:hypothetical protein